MCKSERLCLPFSSFFPSLLTTSSETCPRPRRPVRRTSLPLRPTIQIRATLIQSGPSPSLLAIPLAMSVPSSAPSLPPCGLFRRHHEFSSYTNTSPDQLATAAGSLSVPLISVSSFSNEGTTIALGAGNDFDLVASSSSGVQSPLSPSGIPVRSGQYRALYESFVSTRSRVVQVREGNPIDITSVR